MQRSVVFGTALAALLGVSAPAQASLIGDIVTIEALFPDIGTVFADDVVVVASPIFELACPAPPGTFEICDSYYTSNETVINIEAFSIRQDYFNFSSYTTAAFNGHRFSDLDFAGGLTLVGFTLLTNLPGLTAGRVSFTADSISINLQGLDPEQGNFWLLNLQTSATAIPEPMTLLLVATGAAAAVRRRIRRERKTTPGVVLRKT